MKGFLVLTYLLFFPLLTLIIVSATTGDGIIGVWIVLFLLDLAVGIGLQYRCDRDSDKEKAKAAFLHLLTERVTEILEEEKNVLQRFTEIYNKIRAEGGARLVRSLQEEEAGQFLRTVCLQMPYAPAERWLVGARAVCIEKWDETPVILYIFDNERWEICQNCYVILANTRDDGLRFFCVEADSAGWMLCEYHDGSHINYGVVDLKVLPERVKEILKKPVDNLPF